MFASTAPPQARSFFLAAFLLAGAAIAWQFQSAFAASGSTIISTGTGSTSVMVMKHLCNGSIKTLADLQALESHASDPVQAFLQAEAACPVIHTPDQRGLSGAIAGPAMPFAFDMIDAQGTVHPWSQAAFTPQSICESAGTGDVNGDGVVSGSTCYDISHYDFTLPTGPTTVLETLMPSGASFGTVRFTPSGLVPNNDAASLKTMYAANGVILLDTSADTDRSVMLHVYNFGGSGAVAGSGSSMSSSSLSTSTGVPLCMGKTATIYVANGIIHGGPMNGQQYTGFLQGTGGADVMVGTSGDDHMVGAEGNDIICGLAGNDYLQGDQDNDTVVGGTGKSLLEGGQGADTIISAGQVTMKGGSEEDLLCGGDAAGYLNGEDGNDTIDGGLLNGDEGGNGTDVCYSGAWQANCEDQRIGNATECTVLRGQLGVSYSVGGISSESSVASIPASVSSSSLSSAPTTSSAAVSESSTSVTSSTSISSTPASSLSSELPSSSSEVTSASSTSSLSSSSSTAATTSESASSVSSTSATSTSSSS